jgi:hypothetical protein
MTEVKTGDVRPVQCFKEGWELIKDQYWLLFAITLVGALIGGFSMYILLGAMLCGIYHCYLQKIDGKKVDFDGLWVGFQKWLPSLLLTILIVVPMLIVYFVIYVPFIMAAIMGSKLSSDELTGLFVGAILVDLILVILMVCFHTLLLFSFPLIVDRNLGVWQSITVSAKAVWKNLGGIAGMIGVAFLGSLLIVIFTCGLGAYFLMPIMFAGYTVAYRKIFPAPGNQNFNPPPPNAFRNAGSYNQ